MANKSQVQQINDLIKANNEAVEFGKQSAQNELNEMKIRLEVSKDYRHKYGMTWEEFCEYAGLVRRTVDKQLEDLEPCRADFLASFANLVGDDISKIKYLGRAISAKLANFSDEGIHYDGRIIPLTPEYKDELSAILDELAEKTRKQEDELSAQKKASDRIQSDLHKRINKLEKDAERRKGVLADRDLSDEEAGFIKEMAALRLAFDGLLINANPDNFEELALDRDPSPRIRAAMVSTAYYMRMQILKYYDVVEQTYGDAIMNPEQSPFAGSGFSLVEGDKAPTGEIPS